MTCQPKADLKAVCTGVGTELRTQLAEVLREPTPERMTDLLKQLDQPPRRRSPVPSGAADHRPHDGALIASRGTGGTRKDCKNMK
jgi:hypothetical protein